MTSNNPDEIRQDIERTRANLSDDVNALAETANPKNIAQNQVDKARESVGEKVGQVKEKVFGREDDWTDNGLVGSARGGVDEARFRAEDAAEQARLKAAGAVDDVRYKAQDAVDGVRQNVADAPRAVRRNTRGNPLAAGLVAFGLGALVGGLMPASEAEKKAAGRVKEQAEPYVEQARDLAKDAAATLQEPAQQAAEQVKQAASNAASNVKDEADFAKLSVQETAAQAKDEVTTQAEQAKDNVKDA